MQTIHHDLEQEAQLDSLDDNSGQTNPYYKLIVNKAENIDPLMTQMEQWSILSNVLNYVQQEKVNLMKNMLGQKINARIKLAQHKRKNLERLTLE